MIEIITSDHFKRYKKIILGFILCKYQPTQTSILWYQTCFDIQKFLAFIFQQLQFNN